MANENNGCGQIERELSISVVGVGGAGNNHVNNFNKTVRQDVNLMAINTDREHLEHIDAPVKLYIGKKLTDGNGTSGDIELGRTCMDAVTDIVREKLKTSDIVFVIAGMGGGTGTGGAPVVASIAKDVGAYVFGVAIMPFKTEGRRVAKAADGLKVFKKNANNVVVIDNNDLLGFPNDLCLDEAFQIIDDVISGVILNVIKNIQTKNKVEAKQSEVKGADTVAQAETSEVITYYLMEDEVEEAEREREKEEEALVAECRDVIKVDVTGIAKTCKGTTGKERASEAKKIAKMVAAGDGFGMPRDQVFISRLTDFSKPEKPSTQAQTNSASEPRKLREVQPLIPSAAVEQTKEPKAITKRSSMTLNKWITFERRRMDMEKDKQDSRKRDVEMEPRNVPDRIQSRLDHVWV